MEVEFTPRFSNIIGDSRMNIFIEEKRKKKRHTSENVSNFKTLLKQKSNKKVKNREKSKSNKNINNILNQKFILRNDYDKEHCKRFLKEKYVCMEKPKLIDEICI